MRKNLLALLLGFALLGALLALGTLILDRLVATPEDRAFRSAFRAIEPGTSEQRVLELLGEPDERSTRFFLGQELGYEEAYRRAADGDAVRYLVWRREIDLVYSVGIDASGRVAVAEVGGT